MERWCFYFWLGSSVGKTDFPVSQHCSVLCSLGIVCPLSKIICIVFLTIPNVKKSTLRTLTHHRVLKIVKSDFSFISPGFSFRIYNFATIRFSALEKKLRYSYDHKSSGFKENTRDSKTIEKVHGYLQPWSFLEYMIKRSHEDSQVLCSSHTQKIFHLVVLHGMHNIQRKKGETVSYIHGPRIVELGA